MAAPEDEKIEVPCEYIVQLAQRFLPLRKWGFQESARLTELSDTKFPGVIRNSHWCRICLSFNGWEPPYQSQEYALRIYYGRLHAPDDKDVMRWNDQECWCWHLVDEALHFLDNHTPEYTVENLYPHDIIRKYQESESAKSLRHNLPEWEIRKHAYIWEHYAPRLFELFDLRRPDLWEQYRQYLKEVYDIKGRSPNIKPPPDKIC